MHGLLSPPAELRVPEFLLRPIRPADAEMDHDAVMESKEFLRAWEQTGWPEDDFTVEANREDLVRLERRHKAGESFAYTVVAPSLTQCLGCVYIFPTAAPLFTRAQIFAHGDHRWREFEVAVYFWARKSVLPRRFEQRLLEHLSHWLQQAWNVPRHLFVTSELYSQQVALLASTGRTLRFELSYPNKAGKELAYAA
jgi:hypothetical protein